MGLVDGCMEFFDYLRSLWDMFPTPVRMVILGAFVLSFLLGTMKMLD